MSNIFSPKEEKKKSIISNIRVIKIIAIILGFLIIIGLIGLFIGLAKNYKKIEDSENKKEVTIFNFSQPRDAQLISSSLGLDNEVLLRYLYKGNNVLVILDKNTKKKKVIITIKKELNDW
jgi:hypothetical protein